MAGSEPVRGNPQLLPLLAEMGGPAGSAVHQALACGLGAAFAEGCAAVVDALLSLAAQGAFEVGLLGREAGKLLRVGAVRPGRLAAACAELADAGAPRLAWAVLAASSGGGSELVAEARALVGLRGQV
ncbi:hypothetical protein [Kitasatospora sp. NPDC059673]|uniref:hypothetical protein n=1 Tax=Kitasatospora sp. NPDC059673 TaxID=3346901 RepID=UPI0036963222